MARQADDANIVSEIFTAELRTEAEVLSCELQLIFQLNIAEGLAVLVAFGRQAVVILR